MAMLSLVLPTYNEAANLTSLIGHIDGVLQQTPHEIIIVDDDSPDGTWKVAESLKREHPSLKVLRRIGRKGLSSAVTEGFDMAAGDVLVVMDADGQHDATLILKLLLAIQSGADIAIGSRYVAGGSVGEWVTDRRVISSAGTLLAKVLSHVPVSDPLSGFFAIRATLYKDIRPYLKPTGFKILLEVLANVPPKSRVVEVPLVFRMRLHGQSKLSLRVQLDFLGQVLRLGTVRIFSGIAEMCGLLFWSAVIVTIAVLLPRLWAMRFLYIDPAVRAATEQAVRTAALRQGWLLSDISVLRSGKTSVSIVHREHRRNPAKPQYCTITFSSKELRCED